MLPHLIKNDPTKRKANNNSKTFQIECPSCGNSITIQFTLANSALSCPWCHHIFTPNHAESRYNSMSWNNSDTLQDWDHI